MASEESRSEGPRTERFWERHSHGDREKIAVAGAGARGAPGGDAVWVAPSRWVCVGVHLSKPAGSTALRVTLMYTADLGGL